MTGWEVLSDAIKIGLPSLLTYSTTRLIERSKHSREIAKERIRRRQDGILHAVSEFETAHESINALVALVKITTALHREADNAKSNELTAVMRTNLRLVETRLLLLRLAESLERLKEYQNVTRQLTKELLALRPYDVQPWFSARDRFLKSVSESFELTDS